MQRRRKRLICARCSFNPYPFTVCLTRRMVRKMRDAGWSFPRRIGPVLCPECAREAVWRQHDKRAALDQLAELASPEDFLQISRKKLIEYQFSRPPGVITRK